MKHVVRLSARLQQNHDLVLMGLLAVMPVSALPQVPLWFSHAFLALLSMVCLAVMAAKLRATVGTRVPRTEKLWGLLWLASLAGLVLSVVYPHYTQHTLPAIGFLMFLVSLNDRACRYALAQRRVVQRRRQQARWRKSKQSVLAEWKERLRWLAGVQHDMRQPLHALGLLVRHPSLGQTGREIKGLTSAGQVVEQLVSCHRWLQELAENTMEAARLELNESRDKHIGRISSIELCSGLSDWMRQLAESKGLQFETHIDECQLYTDIRRLKRVMGNLLFNAVEHTFEGSVSLRYRRQGGVHQFEIRDTGPGMNLDLLNNKYAVQSSFGSDLPKTGLGLYVVKRLCWEMDWNLSVQNELSGGTTFTLELADQLPQVNAGECAEPPPANLNVHLP